MKNLQIAEFEDGVLRLKARFLTLAEMQSPATSELIENMHHTLISENLGIGLAAPQVGQSVAVAVVNIHKTPLRPEVEEFKMVIVNPKITQTFGRRVQLWEGCISSGKKQHGLFTKVPRYKKIELEYYDQNAQKYTQIFKGLPAHVIQHEVDHLNGILFVDKVKDTRTFMTYGEYRKMKEEA